MSGEDQLGGDGGAKGGGVYLRVLLDLDGGVRMGRALI